LIRLFFGKGNQVQAGVSNKLINIFMDTSKLINKRITHPKRYRATKREGSITLEGRRYTPE